MQHHTSTRRTRNHRLLGLAAAGAIGVGAVAASTAPASADVKDSDRPKVTASHIDFGTNWTLGAPRNGGYLDWDYSNGQVTPRLSGYLYLTDEECGRVHMEYYDSDNDFLADRDTATYCAPGNGKTQWWVTITSFSHPDVESVHVELERQVSGGYAYVDGTSEDFD